MATIRPKRKREIQDDLLDYVDNFQYFRALDSKKRRRSTGSVLKPVKENVCVKEARTSVQKVNAELKVEDFRSPLKPGTSGLVTPFKTWRNTLRGQMRRSFHKKILKGMTNYDLPYLGTEDLKRFSKECQKDKQVDLELQQKIDHEIKMRDGTAKLLAASKHPAQMLEAAKNLLSSNHRMIAYMSELQKRKTDEVMGKKQSTAGNQVPCKGRVGISDLRIPLMWKDSDHFKNKGDHRRYAVFVLLKIGTEIYDSSLIKDVDRTCTDITFEDSIVFQNIPHDFECRAEIYCHKLWDDLTIASTPKKIKKKIHDVSSSMGRSVGKRLSGLKEDPESLAGNMTVGPKFELLGYSTMRLSDASEHTRTYDITLESQQESCELPLFGNLCCRMAVQPYCMSEETCTGYLYIKNIDGVSDDWTRHWCVLKELQLNCWNNPANMHMVMPDAAIPITKETQVCEADPSTMVRPHTLYISANVFGERKQYTFAAESKEDWQMWWEGLQQHLLDQVLWQHVCENKMTIKPPNENKIPTFMRKGSASSTHGDIPYGSTPSVKKTHTSSVTAQDDHPEFSPLTLMLRRLTSEDDQHVQPCYGRSRHSSRTSSTSDSRDSSEL
ncbi:rhotekin [Lingula anatina]|uniref:Rhotekin n=1 Tax=Lingula anatina TaxID=7574 RepID=A0A1S3IZR7_LINAN|nr:rhotekin [Lingula anatina]|eukprot:XP_013403692.1 rhotekin [Lingula anatina]